jgi:hypothetical protein
VVVPSLWWCVVRPESQSYQWGSSPPLTVGGA